MYVAKQSPFLGAPRTWTRVLQACVFSAVGMSHLFSLSAAAEVQVSVSCISRCGYFGGFIEVRGTIEGGDTDRLRHAFVGAPETIFPYGIALNLDGGDLHEALRLGRWIRENGYSTIVAADAKCIGTCLFAFAGGIGRFPSGEITAGGVDLEGVTGEMFKEALLGSKQFLAEMGVLPPLAAAIFENSPSDHLPLSEFDLLQFNLDQSDVFWQRHTALTQMGESEICQRLPTDETQQECMLFAAILYELVSPLAVTPPRD